MSHGHIQVLCKKCGTVIRQCRCMSTDKTITYETCDKCKSAVFDTLIPDTKQQLREALAREVYLRYQLTQLTEEIEQLRKNNER